MKDPRNPCCEDNKMVHVVEGATDTDTKELVEILHCICTVCDFEWVE